MRLSAVVLAVLAVFALGACGGGGGTSKQDKAKSEVCSARDDIGQQVDKLKGLTLSTATLDTVQTSLKAIEGDLTKIKNAAGDLSSDSKKELQQANQAFVTQINSIASSLLKTTSLSQAQAQAQTALSQLADAYQKTFAQFSCG